jgi:peptidoglycan/xylan/chitin deacetylase (PgdA/CDA1 family)
MIDTIKVPAIFLSFDDWWETEWVKYLPILAENNVKATFYPCIRNIYSTPFLDSEEKIRSAIRPAFWQSLKEIRDKGHTVGFHSVNHLRFGYLKKDLAFQKLMEIEIQIGLKTFTENGFRPRHFAYPFGSYSTMTNEVLLNYFLTLRTIVLPGNPNFMMRTYSLEQLQEMRIFIGYDIKYPDWQSALKTVLDTKSAGFFFTHNPRDSNSELNELFYSAKVDGATFYPMSALEEKLT